MFRAWCARLDHVTFKSVYTPLSASTHSTKSLLFDTNLSCLPQTRSLHATPMNLGLEEFFDDPAKGWVWEQKDLPTGRAWMCSELRHKSFDDLHKLWWVCAKQQNLLASQKEEARRFRITLTNQNRLKQVRKTMKNIKMVIWERKSEWEKAQDIFQLEKKRLELETQGATPLEASTKVAQTSPTKALNLEATAAALQLTVNQYAKETGIKDKPDLGRKRAKKGMFGYTLKQLPKKSTWFTV